jgi:ribulose-5-phosphate 4-epimerase/fuculose-1-phosphate aldolase
MPVGRFPVTTHPRPGAWLEQAEIMEYLAEVALFAECRKRHEPECRKRVKARLTGAW